MKLFFIIFLIASCSQNNEGMNIINIQKGSTCVNGWTHERYRKGYVVLFNAEGKPLQCSMTER